MKRLYRRHNRFGLVHLKPAERIARSGAIERGRPSRFLRSYFARRTEFAVNPLLNSVGCHAHEVRLCPAARNCFADLELPFPQSRLHLRDGEFNAFAVHLCSPPTRLNGGGLA
jgi:hypothetical protein